MKKYLDDLFVILGCGLVIYGVWEIYAPAVPIAAGIMLIAAGFIVGAAGRDGEG